MISLWTGMLLLHGHIHDPELVRRLANAPPTSPSRKSGGKRQRVRSSLAAFALSSGSPLQKGTEAID